MRAKRNYKEQINDLQIVVGSVVCNYLKKKKQNTNDNKFLRTIYKIYVCIYKSLLLGVRLYTNI